MKDIKEQFYNKYDSLSTRARFILLSLRLDSFEAFHNFFIEQNKAVDFGSLQNCGPKTEKELNLLRDLIMRSGAKKPTENYENVLISTTQILMFENQFYQLSVRTKNILEGIGASHLQGFLEKVLNNKMSFTINRIRNCGEKSYKEILDFSEKVRQILTDKLKEGMQSDIQQNVYPDFNRIAELRFSQSFDGLSTRTKNVLADLQAASLSAFYNLFFKNASSHKLLGLKNCGVKTFNEINEFKRRINHLLESDNDINADRALFTDLAFYLFEGKALKAVEISIVVNYFGFVYGEKYKSFEDIATENNLSQERVRQLSIKLLDSIANVVRKLCENGHYELTRYFREDNFFITTEFALMVNEGEKVDFSPAFMTFVLQSVENEDFDFLCIDKKYKNYSGLFAKKIKVLDLALCFDYLWQFANVRRVSDVSFEVNTLFKKFRKKDLPDTNAASLKNDKDSFIEFLKVFAAYFTTNESQVFVSEETVVFKKNTKWFLYHHIEEILDYYKKPMHFTDLYRECCERSLPVESAINVHATMQHRPDIFGLKGQGVESE